MNEITLRPPAKINLTLDVGARRADGYHDIRSIMQTVSLHDTLTMRLVPGQGGVTMEVFGEEAAGVPTDAANIVHRAAVRLWNIAVDRGRQTDTGVHFHLHKQIPSQAGLGGGSSDAAAALRGLNALLGLNLPAEHLATIGAELGADVPFFLTCGTALVESLGERVTGLPDLAPPWPLVIVKPPVGVSTAWAYAALDAAERAQGSDETSRWLSGVLRPANDFHPVIVPAFPEIAAAFEFFLADPDRFFDMPPLLCGSGSALFCRAASQEGAERIAARVHAADLGKAWAVRTVGR